MMCRNGFALIELIMAMAVSALLLLGSRVLLVQATDSATRISAHADELTSEANSERMLRWLVLQTDTAGVPFQGSAHEARFQSRCDTPHGWTERCDVLLYLTDMPSGRYLAMNTSVVGFESDIVTSIRADALTYLLSAAGGGEWMHDWSFRLTLPQAIGLIEANDTSILRIGLSR